MPRPAGPVPPTTPIRIARASHTHHAAPPPRASPRPHECRNSLTTCVRQLTLAGLGPASSLAVVGIREHGHGTNVASLARAQHGLVSYPQLVRVLGSGPFRAWIRNGRLEIRAPRRVPRRAARHPLGNSLCSRPASRHPAASASFRSAAALWELEGFAREGVEITVPGRASYRARPASRSTTAWWVAHSLRHVVTDIPVTSAARTLCDLTAVSPRWHRRASRSMRACDARS